MIHDQPPALPSGKKAIAEMVRQHMRSADGQRLLDLETARQLQRVADCIGGCVPSDKMTRLGLTCQCRFIRPQIANDGERR